MQSKTQRTRSETGANADQPLSPNYHWAILRNTIGEPRKQLLYLPGRQYATLARDNVESPVSGYGQ
jgi:hypothetical protein